MTRILLFLINHSFSKDKKTLVHQLEILAHIQRQSGLPARSPNSPDRIMMALVLSLGLLGIYMQIIILLGAIIWIVIAAVTNINYYVTSETGNFSIIFIVFTIFMVTYIMEHFKIRVVQEYYISWHYPCQTTSLFDHFQKNSSLIMGYIDNLQGENQTTQIEYSFYLSDVDKTIRGYYLTSSEHSFVPGEKIAVRYLNESIHIPVFEMEE